MGRNQTERKTVQNLTKTGRKNQAILPCFSSFETAVPLVLHVPAAYVQQIESFSLEMRKKLAEFDELQMHEKTEGSLEVTKKKIRVDQIEHEIEILVDRILSANTAPMEYINRKIEDPDSEKMALRWDWDRYDTARSPS